MVRYCKYCGKLLPKSKGTKGSSHLYCNPQHRAAYFHSLHVERINKISPEEFIRKELQREPVQAISVPNKTYCNEIKFSKAIQSNRGIYLHQNYYLKNVLQVKTNDVIEIKIRSIYRLNPPKESVLENITIPAVITSSPIQLLFKSPILKRMYLKYGDVIELNIKVVYRS